MVGILTQNLVPRGITSFVCHQKKVASFLFTTVTLPSGWCVFAVSREYVRSRSPSADDSQEDVQPFNHLLSGTVMQSLVLIPPPLPFSSFSGTCRKVRKTVGGENQKREIFAPVGQEASVPIVSLSRFKLRWTGNRWVRRPTSHSDSDPWDILRDCHCKKKLNNTKQRANDNNKKKNIRKNWFWQVWQLFAAFDPFCFVCFFSPFFPPHFVPVLFGSVLLPTVFTSDK